MAWKEKLNSGSYRIRFYHPVEHKKNSVFVQFTGNAKETEQQAKLKKVEIEHKIALHQNGLETFSVDEEKNIAAITLGKFHEIISNDKYRRTEVDEYVMKNQLTALKNLIGILGDGFTLEGLASNRKYMQQFKQARFDMGIKRNDSDVDKVKRGVNNLLKDLSAVFNYAAKAGYIPEHFVPTIEKYKTITKKEVVILEDHEIIGILQALDLSGGKSDNTLKKGDAWLAYVIIKETGLRRSAVARKTLRHTNGLKWKHIDWMRNSIIVQDKGEEYSVPMTDLLRETLLKRQKEITAHPEAYIIRFTRSTLTHYFKKAMRKAGVDKPGSVHILRHTLPVQLLEQGATAFDVQAWFNHEDMRTTKIYVHVANKRLQQIAKRRSNTM